MIPPRIKDIIILDDFCIKIFYSSGDKKLYDMKKLLKLNCYKRLRNISYFKLAKSVETTIEWPKGEDIDPNELFTNSKTID